VPPPAVRPGQRATVAEGILTRIVFLPFYPELPGRESHRMATAVLKFCDHAAANTQKLQLITDGGDGLRPSVCLDDNARLLDIMEERSGGPR